jgi:hypothetical protein
MDIIQELSPAANYLPGMGYLLFGCTCLLPVELEGNAQARPGRHTYRHKGEE